MEGYLQSGSLYCPGYRTGCAPDSDTSCVALERQCKHSLGLERSLVKTLVPPSSQLHVGLVSCSGEGSLGLLHIGHAVLPPASLCPGLGRVYYTTVHQKCDVSPGAHPLATQFLSGMRWSNSVFFYLSFLNPQFFSPCFTHKRLKMVHPVHVYVVRIIVDMGRTCKHHTERPFCQPHLGYGH